MALVLTVVLTVPDVSFEKTKHVTATGGQAASFHTVGEIAREAWKKQLGPNITDSQVVLTSVTVA